MVARHSSTDDEVYAPTASTSNCRSVHLKLLPVPVSIPRVGTEWIDGKTHACQNPGNFHTGIEEGELWLEIKPILVMHESLLMLGNDELL